MNAVQRLQMSGQYVIEMEIRNIIINNNNIVWGSGRSVLGDQCVDPIYMKNNNYVDVDVQLNNINGFAFQSFCVSRNSIWQTPKQLHRVSFAFAHQNQMPNVGHRKCEKKKPVEYPFPMEPCALKAKTRNETAYDGHLTFVLIWYAVFKLCAANGNVCVLALLHGMWCAHGDRRELHTNLYPSGLLQMANGGHATGSCATQMVRPNTAMFIR